MKKNKLAGVALIWLLLAALVFVYTDRAEYTWRYAQEDLQQIVQTSEQAAAAHRAAQAALDLEREAAAKRQAQMQWGGHEQYGGAKETLPARDGEPGLNLMSGTYEVTLSYASPEPLELRVVSAECQAFVQQGDVTLDAQAEGQASFAFTLSGGARDVMLACDLPAGGAIHAVTVHKQGAGVFSRDLAAYALIVGGIAAWLYLLAGDASEEGKKRRRDALVLVLAAAFASLPALMEHIVDGHDLFFHMNRIEGIASALRGGQFPVRIHASTLQGYGYAASQFYPELFLYIPALLRSMGVSLMACVQVTMILINLATALVCAFSVRRMTGDRDVALLASVLYTLSIYRLVSLYAVSTLGEALAMIFFPLLAYALFEVILRDARSWPLLACSMFAIFMSHLLSTLLAAAFCALAALCCVKRLVREPGRILACVKAALLMAFCSLWFVIPFVQYSAAGISTNVVLSTFRYRLSLAELLIGFSSATGDAHSVGRALGGTIGTQPGLAILMGCALLAVRCYAQGGSEDQDRLPLRLMALGTLALLGSTALFPWEKLCGMGRPFGTLFQQIQYPRRMLSIATPLLVIPAAAGYLRYEKHRAAGAALALALSVVFAGYFMGDFVMQEPILDKEGYADTRIRQYEYTYLGTEKGLLVPGEAWLGDIEEPVEAITYGDGGITLRLVPGAEGAYLEAPLLYYPGYEATINGEPCKIERGSNNVVRIYAPFTREGDVIRIAFKAPVLWRIAELVSALAMAGMVYLLARKQRA